MSSPRQSGQNSILHLLNPYASVAQPSHSRDQGSTDSDQLPAEEQLESPSAVLLRELQSKPDGPQFITAPSRIRSPPMSPTPTARRPTHVIATPDPSSEDEGLPPSVMFTGAAGMGSRDARQGRPGAGDSTPRSREGAAGDDLAVPVRPWGHGHGQAARSPGPFRRRLSSASSSTRSRHSSPGPSRQQSVDSSLPSGMSTSVHSPTLVSSTSEDVPLPPRQIAAPKRTSAPAAPKVAPLPSQSPLMGEPHGDSPPMVPGPSRSKYKGKTRTKTKGRGQHKYHSVPSAEQRDDGLEPRRSHDRKDAPDLKKAGLSEKNKALWQWVNVVNLDSFLQDVYYYYKAKGFWCIILGSGLQLLTMLFIIVFSFFLTSCISYSELTHSASGPDAHGRLSEAIVDKCVLRASFPRLFLLTLMGVFWLAQVIWFVGSIKKHAGMWRFYTYLLRVPDTDIQTLPWPEIVRLIGEIKKDNPVTSLSNGQATALAEMVGPDDRQTMNAVLDAHDIANRILRQENYLIALFNKELLDLRVRIPLPGALAHFVPPTLRTGRPSGLPRSSLDDDERQYLTFGGNTLSVALEWNLRYCLMGYLFDDRGQVRKEVVRDKGRKDLVEELRRRLIFMGIVNAMLAPFIVVYLLVYSFFRYFEEYRNNPSSIGTRQYTLYARWKFREFNELPHLFERRLDRSYPIAREYIGQFPKERTAIIGRFVAFIAGSFAAVLLVASIVDPDLFLHFEITPHRTVLFYLGVFGSILAIARGMIPEENSVFDPDYLMREVIRFTHYLPNEWKGQLHSQQVLTDFGNLFQLKVTIFAQEVVSVLLTPFILLFSLPPCAGAIIDFFREFSIHVEGLGYVCSFAVFDFQRAGNIGPEGAATEAGPRITSPVLRRRPGASQRSHSHRGPVSGPEGGDEYGPSMDKMEQSFLHFKATHPDWQPTDPSSSVRLERLTQLAPPPPMRRNHRDARSPATRHQHSLTASTHGRGLGLGLGLAGAVPGPAGKNIPGMVLSPGLDEGERRYFRHELETMEEGEDSGVRDAEEEDTEAEMMGWNRRVGPEDDDDDEKDDRGLLRDAGMILQQVMNR